MPRGVASGTDHPVRVGARRLLEALDQRHFVAHVVIAQLVDHPLQIRRPKPPGAEAQLVADVEMRERVVGRGGVGRFGPVEPRPLVADDDLDAVVVDPVGDVDQPVGLVPVAPLDGVLAPSP